ncbi:MAG: hypothetical protein IMZ55_02410 [Acidobacteria bacterium]|nr:hypothetical protein [Acidobacteriota bacterium]
MTPNKPPQPPAEFLACCRENMNQIARWLAIPATTIASGAGTEYSFARDEAREYERALYGPIPLRHD